jgi:hypothetical protein
LFEPIIAAAIGGTPVSAGKSPVRRTANDKKGRQVDCLKGKLAYEMGVTGFALAKPGFYRANFQVLF